MATWEQRAVKNCIESYGNTSYLDENGYAISNSLHGAFNWKLSYEGYRFWSKIFLDLILIDL